MRSAVASRVIRKHFGSEPLGVFEDADEINRFKIDSDYEEKKLLDTALQRMNTPEHGYAGPLLHDRIIGALELCCRRGEMLMIQNKRVNWDTHQISIPGATAKDRENRRIPFNPHERMVAILERRGVARARAPRASRSAAARRRTLVRQKPGPGKWSARLFVRGVIRHGRGHNMWMCPRTATAAASDIRYGCGPGRSATPDRTPEGCANAKRCSPQRRRLPREERRARTGWSRTASLECEERPKGWPRETPGRPQNEKRPSP
jgi:hypothetical protein